jgi:hypothetical protein
MASEAAERSVAVRMTTRAAREAARRAALCGLDVPHWAGQVIEAFLAGERCQHGPPRPATPTTSETPSGR